MIKPLIPGGPVDWAAWEYAALNRPKKILSIEQQAKMQDAVRAYHKRKRELEASAKVVARIERGEPDPAALPAWATSGVRQIDWLFAHLQPGAWYAVPDMHKLTGLNYGSCKGWAPLYAQKGFLERRHNPAWKPPERPGMAQQPKWLYRLTEKGVARHGLAYALL